MAHEDLTREQHVEGSSNRSFGIVFAIVFLIIAVNPLRHGAGARWWALALSALFLVIALWKPALLAGLNRQWTRLGVAMGAVVSPIALGLLFYGVLTPLAIAMRLAGKDPLRLRFDPHCETYWIRRVPPGPPPQSMTNQF